MSDLLPHKKEDEQSLLGAILLDSSLLTRLHIPSDLFYIEDHQIIYKAMVELGDSLNLVTLVDKLPQFKTYASLLIKSCPSTLYAESYLDILQKILERRQIVLLANDMASAAYSGNVDKTQYLDRLTGQSNGAGTTHIRTFTRQLEHYVQDRQANPAEVWGIPTGLSEFDTWTGGLHKKRLVLVCGKPKVGKTILLCQTAKHAASKGYKVAVYETELSGIDTASRLVTASAGVIEQRMHQGKLKDDELIRLGQAVSELNDLPIYLSEETHWTSASLSADVARLQADHGVDLVIIDSMKRLNDKDYDSSWANEELKSARIRAMAKNLDVAVFTVHNLIKGDGTHMGLDDVSGSAEVTYIADEVFFLVENKDNYCSYGKPRQLVAKAQRFGGQKGWIDLVLHNDKPELVTPTLEDLKI
jgi:replicative DNA helicase